MCWAKTLFEEVSCPPPSLQILVTLRFYANENYKTVTDDFHGISKARVSRIVNAVSSALVALNPNFIKFPRDDRVINGTIRGISRIANFPDVIGAVLHKIRYLGIKMCQLSCTNVHSQ